MYARCGAWVVSGLAHGVRVDECEGWTARGWRWSGKLLHAVSWVGQVGRLGREVYKQKGSKPLSKAASLNIPLPSEPGTSCVV